MNINIAPTQGLFLHMSYYDTNNRRLRHTIGWNGMPYRTATERMTGDGAIEEA